MATDTTYDYIITGFGCAGMSLIYYLLQSSLSEKKILVIDSELKQKNDRTWCYWGSKPLDIHPTGQSITSWKNISVSNGSTLIKKPLQALSYYHIRSSDFYTKINTLIQEFPNVHILRDKVVQIKKSYSGNVDVETAENGLFTGSYVFNSIPAGNFNLHKGALKQVFLGWHVKSASPCFDADTALLMDFVKNGGSGNEFFYVLPFNSNEALVEYTSLGTDVPDFKTMEPHLQAYLATKYGIEQYEVSFTEQGIIPMTTQNHAPETAANIINIGILGGCTRPSTGYTFTNIQKHCKAIVDALSNHKTISDFRWTRKNRFNFYDNILLNVVRKWPEELPHLFFDLFQANPAPSVLKFMDEESSFTEDLLLFSKLRFPVFLKSLANYEKH
jgi:lycopene beta-cyclase